MEELARNLEVDGLTNYQKALKDALTEFALPGLGSKNKHLLFLTDGAPTQGCAELEPARGDAFVCVSPSGCGRVCSAIRAARPEASTASRARGAAHSA